MTARRQGFTLIELLITLPIAVVLLIAVIQTYVACGRLMDSQRIRNNLTGNVRTGMDYLIRDISMAGYGFKDCKSALSQWITWIPSFTNALIIKHTAGQPDRVTLAGAFSRVTVLSEPVSAGAASIRVPSNVVFNFNTTNRHLIYIGRSELARITGISGNTLNISTKPVGAAGLSGAYPSNAPVELIQVISYSVTNYAENNYLIRSDTARPTLYFGYAVPWDNILAMDVCDMQLSKSNQNVYITVKGISPEPDRNYHDPVTGDNRRRITLSGEVYMRN